VTLQAEKPDIPSWPFYVAIAAYFSLHILLRVVISPTLDYDEAEQAMLAQWLLPGYTEQPPLYTWLQYGLFHLVGHNVFAVALFKNLLLFLTYVFVFLSSREILKNNRAAMLAAFSLLLIPQIGWESQRDMTHTTLVVCAAAATLWQGLCLLRCPHWRSYCFLGVIMAVGILAKANFLLLLTILSITLATFPEGRHNLLNRKTIAALVLALLLSSPYLLWMANHQDILFSTTHKFKQGREFFYLAGPFSLLKNSVLFLGPLLLIFPCVFPEIFKRQGFFDKSINQRFINRYIAVLFLVVLLFVLLFQVTYVKDRWLQPLLFAFPIFLFSRISSDVLTATRCKRYLGIITIAAAAIYLAFTLRVVAAEKISKFCRLNYPIKVIAEDLRQEGFTRGLFITDDRFLAGNFSLTFPDSKAIIPGYNFESLAATDGRIVIIWKVNNNNGGIPETLSTFLRDSYSYDLSNEPIHYITSRYLYATASKLTFGVIFLHPPSNTP